MTLYKFNVYNTFIYYDIIDNLAIVNNSIKSHNIFLKYLKVLTKFKSYQVFSL